MKKAGDETRYSQDETGQWWWIGISNGGKYRLRVFVYVCEFCHEEFLLIPNRKDRRYCSRSCSSRAFMVRNPDFFKGENNGHWDGGKIKCKGYIMVHNPQHPVCQGNKRKYIGEHRLVMEEYLGRFLEPYESVHHKNGVKNDNRIENLELWTKAHPVGIRVGDLPHCPTCTCEKH